MEGSKNGPPHFPGEKAGRECQERTEARTMSQEGVDMSAGKTAWEFTWLHAVTQSREKHSMEDVKMTQVFVQG